MAEIVKVTKKGSQYKLQLDDARELLVSEDQLVEFRLLKGQEIKEETIEKIKQAGNISAGLELVYRYLNFGLRSEKEVVTYLKEKEVPFKHIPKIIAKLKELELINDDFYAKSYVRTQMKLSDKGPKVLMMKLKEKGIAESIITAALEEFSFDLQVENASKLFNSYWQKQKQQPYQKRLQKTKVHLLQKGFSNEVLQLALENLEEKEDETELLQKWGEKAYLKYQKLTGYEKAQKIKEFLYRKGFSMDDINTFVSQYQEESGGKF